MKVLLLGGTGAMGVPLMRILAKENNEVYVTSRSSRTSTDPHIHYIVGNARNDNFLKYVLNENYDAIVDFMHYYPEELSQRIDLLLSNTNHYFFLSSCRVYAPSVDIITEDSPRLLEWAEDKKFLSTKEYALSKARCENLLIESGRTNWTIIRPYITYNTERLQLSVFEKEGWLYRALKGRSIVFCRDLASKLTTLTTGEDVARAIYIMIADKTGFGEAVHITGEESMTWGDVLEIYCDILENVTGKRPKVVMIDDSLNLSKMVGNTYKTKYDRLSNRTFDNSKAQKLCSNKLVFTPIKEGLSKSIIAFVNEKRNFKYIDWTVQAFLDRQSGEVTRITEIPNIKLRVLYLLYRFTPYIKKRLCIDEVSW